jgi:hypothetical protein
MLRTFLNWWHNRPRFFDRPGGQYVEGVGWPIVNDLNDALAAAGHRPVSCEDLQWVLHKYHWHRGSDRAFIDAMLQESILTD